MEQNKTRLAWIPHNTSKNGLLSNVEACFAKTQLLGAYRYRVVNFYLFTIQPRFPLGPVARPTRRRHESDDDIRVSRPREHASRSRVIIKLLARWMHHPQYGVAERP